MTRILVKKLLRDVRFGLIVVALLLFLFELLWARVTRTISGDLLITIDRMTKDKPGSLTVKTLIDVFFSKEGQVVQKLIGGEGIDIQQASNLLTSGFVHPLVQTILCIWAIGRAAGAIAGEIDRGTMELLLAQPITRTQIVRAHLLVDLITIPVLCLSMWAGIWLGAEWFGLTDNANPRLMAYPARFGPSLFNVAFLVFAVSGYTMWFSAAGRFRGRVLGLVIVLTLVMFLVNVIGQLWGAAEPARPLTVFYYYQPQPIILRNDWYSDVAVWGRMAVLLAVGAVGYLMAWRTFVRRDLPAPL
jgi:beta-exotoxin I transport system permease protein